MQKERKPLKAATKSNLITYGILIAAFIIVSIICASNDKMYQFKGMLVPLCIYSIMADRKSVV